MVDKTQNNSKIQEIQERINQKTEVLQAGTLQAGKELTQEVDTLIRHGMAGMDAGAKSLFRYKIILAVILQKTLKEFQNYTPKEIMECLSDISQETEVSAGLTISEETIGVENAESVQNKEKRALLQKTLNLPYEIESRGIYYMARQISSQLNYVFEDTKEYSSLKKVYGIWICLNDIPKSMQNTIVWHNLLPSHTYGIENEKTPCKDLMEMIIIRLGNGEEIELESDILRFLYGIFEYSVHSEYFHEFVSIQEVEQDEDLRKEINEMEGVGLLFYNDMMRRAGRKSKKQSNV